MKKQIAFTVALLAAASVALADADATNKVNAAIAKLKAADNYAWTTTTDMGPDSPFQPGPQKGKALKDGTTWNSSEFNGNTMESFRKGAAMAMKDQDGNWGGGGRGGRGGFGMGGGGMFGMGGGTAPADEAATLLQAVKDLKAGDGGLFSGDYTETAVKDMMSFRGGRGGRGGGGPGGPGGDFTPPEMKNTKGDVKFWVKDGALVKYASHTQGTMSNPDMGDFTINTTRTVEISGVGSTKLDVPADAKKILDTPPAQN